MPRCITHNSLSDSSLQLLIFLSSFFLQIRGSIPLFWSQPADWKLRPPVLLQQHSTTIGTNNRDKVHYDCPQASALKTHLCDLVSTYFAPLWDTMCTSVNYSLRTSPYTKIKAGASVSPKLRNKRPVFVPGTPIHSTVLPKHSVYMINLIDKKGVQGKLGALWHRVFQTLTSASAKVFPRYGYFSNAMRRDSDKHTATAVADAINKGVNEADQNRDYTSHRATQFNVTLPDLLRLHGQRDQNGTFIHEALTQGHDSSSNNSTVMPVDTHLVWFDYHHKCKCNAAATVEIYQIIQSALNSGEGYSVYADSQGANINSDIKENTYPKRPTNIESNSAAISTPTDIMHSMKTLHTQKHIIRTNCMDCLDRTNVMQSIISRWVLVRQLASLDSVVASIGEREGKTTTAQLKADVNKELSLSDKVIVYCFCQLRMLFYSLICYFVFRKWRASFEEFGPRMAII